MSTITGHMVVKNEDQWIWYAINSVLNKLTKLIITDTGSLDNTISIINSIKSKKIVFNQEEAFSPSEIASVRQKQLKQTDTDWFWLIDGDEIYPQDTVNEIINITNANTYEGIVVSRYDLVGDIYHRIDEKVGSYKLFNRYLQASIRLINKSKIKGLHVSGNYPYEDYLDSNGKSIRYRNGSDYYFTEHSYFHTTYLKRSSLGVNLSNTKHRCKYKIESGCLLKTRLPDILFQEHPRIVPSALTHRTFLYNLLAIFITPIKMLKRKLFS